VRKLVVGRKIKVLVTATLFLSLLNPAPSNAILGLSTCEKVKKQVLQMEKIVNDEIRYWNMRVGQEIVNKMQIRGNNFESKNYPKRIWKIAYNNQKCFTPSQNLEINRRTSNEGKSNTYYLINFRNDSRGYGDECKGREKKTMDLGKYGDPIVFCDLPLKQFVELSSDYPSIYSF
jgi:hypothetical protein